MKARTKTAFNKVVSCVMALMLTTIVMPSYSFAAIVDQAADGQEPPAAEKQQGGEQDLTAGFAPFMSAQATIDELNAAALKAGSSLSLTSSDASLWSVNTTEEGRSYAEASANGSAFSAALSGKGWIIFDWKFNNDGGNWNDEIDFNITDENGNKAWVYDKSIGANSGSTVRKWATVVYEVPFEGASTATWSYKHGSGDSINACIDNIRFVSDKITVSVSGDANTTVSVKASGIDAATEIQVAPGTKVTFSAEGKNGLMFNAWKTASDGEELDKAASFEETVYDEAPSYYGTSAAPFEGSGTEAEPYKISGEADLLKLDGYVNKGITFEGAVLQLQGDISDDEAIDFTMVGSSLPYGVSFQGTFDGNGKTISGIPLSRGLFNTLGSKSTVKNLTVDANISASAQYAGILAAQAGGVISNCTVKGSITSSQQRVGGLAGYLHGESGAPTTVEGCTVEAAVSSTYSAYTNSYAGGIAGRATYYSISNCVVSGGVDGGSIAAAVGGIIGGSDESGGTVESCIVAGDVSGYTRIGGIIGWGSAATYVKNCEYKGGVVSAASGDAGGVIGYIQIQNSNSGNQGGAVDCLASGTVSGGSGSAGGIIGYCSYNVTVSDNMSLLQSVTGADGKTDRVAGQLNTSQWYSDPTLSGNHAWDGTTVNGETEESTDAASQAGKDVSAAELYGSTVVAPTDSWSNSAWTVAAGAKPQLLAAAALSTNVIPSYIEKPPSVLVNALAEGADLEITSTDESKWERASDDDRTYLRGTGEAASVSITLTEGGWVAFEWQIEGKSGYQDTFKYTVTNAEGEEVSSGSIAGASWSPPTWAKKYVEVASGNTITWSWDNATGKNVKPCLDEVHVVPATSITVTADTGATAKAYEYGTSNEITSAGPGTKIDIKASVEQGYVFGGWTISSESSEIVNTNATMQGITVTETPIVYHATAVKPFKKGTGLENDPYLIEDIDDLIALDNYVSAGTTFAGQYLKIEAEQGIDASGSAFKSVGSKGGSFDGFFDGNGKTIENLSTEQGLFKKVSGSAEIKDLTVIGELKGSTEKAGMVVGELASGSVTNCTVSGTVSSSARYVGGIAGSLGENASIAKCVVTGDVSGSSYVGGIAGNIGGKGASVSDCDYDGDVEGDDAVGGIVGALSLTSAGTAASVASCVAAGSVSVTAGTYSDGSAGGIVGYANVNVSVFNCVALQQSISSNKDAAGRVVGLVKSGHFGTPTLSNNSAWAGMTVNGSAIASDDENAVADKTHGASLASTDLLGTTVPTAFSGLTNWTTVAGKKPAITANSASTDAYPPYIKIDIADTMVTAADNLVYTGEALDAGVTVKFGSTTYEAGTDYTITYTLNGKDVSSVTVAGEYTATVTAILDATSKLMGATKMVTFTVEKASVTAPTAASGLEHNGQTQTGVAGGTGYTVEGGTATAAGDYTATATLDENYKWSDGTTAAKTIAWSIAKKPVTVAANGASKVYGESDPELTATVTGLVGDDKLTYTVTRDAGENVGTYAITAAGEATQGNYAVTYTGSTFTIGSARVAAPEAATGLAYDKTVKVGVAEGDGYTVTNGSATNAGDYTATVTPAANYVWSDGTATAKEISWSIAKAKATVKANDASKTYGESDPTLAATVTGVYDGDTLDYTVTREAGDDAGAYEITAASSTEPVNYEVTYQKGTFTINKASGMTVSASAVDVPYDKTAHGVTATASQAGAEVKYGTAEGSYTLDASPTYTDAGTYTVYFQATHKNYETATGQQTVKINPIDMTVSADAVAKTYDGKAYGIAPKATDTHGDVAATFKYGTTEGAYNLNASPTYANAGEYTVYYQATDANHNTATGSATISIAKAGDMTVAASNVNVPYDGQPHGVTATSNVPGATIKYGTEAGTYNLDASPTITNVADSPLTVYFQATDANHEPVTGQATVTVTASGDFPVTVSGTSATYDGQPHGVSVTSGVSGAVVKFYNAETDAYDLDASPTIAEVADSPLAVKYQVTDPAGNYTPKTGEATLVLAAASMGDVTIADVPEQAYTGAAVTPALTVKAGDTALSAGTDYTVSYADAAGNAVAAPTQPGTYTATVTGAGNYAGTASTTFTIATPSKTDAATGVVAEGTVFVDKATDGNSVSMTVEDIAKTDPTRFAELEKTYKTDKVEYMAAFKVELGVVSPSGVVVEELTENFGMLRITFPVDAAYNGRAAKIVQLHEKADGTIEEIERSATVADGTVSITVDKLSEFAITIDKATSSTTAATSATSTKAAAAKTGDGLGVLGTSALIVLVLAADVMLIAWMVGMRNKRREREVNSWFKLK